MWSAGSGNPGAFTPGHISVSVEVFSGKSANLLYYILNYGALILRIGLDQLIDDLCVLLAECGVVDPAAYEYDDLRVSVLEIAERCGLMPNKS